MLTASVTPDLHPDRTTAHCLHMLGLYQRLRAQDSLAPSPTVDALFGDLVHACGYAADVDAAAVLADPRIRTLQPEFLHLCAEGETLLEQAWARRILAADDPHAETAAFPYLDNYRHLTRMEIHALSGAGYRPQAGSRICFVGGGPLPLSAVFLHQEFGIEVDVVDRDPDAVALSRDLVQRLVPGGQVRVLAADATSVAAMAAAVAGCAVVVVAALVGLDRAQKQTVLRGLGTLMAPGSHLVVRSAAGLRSLLYPVVNPQDVHEAQFTPEVLVHPLGEVVNSVLVARRR
jgi:nicotianamine synthase